MGLSLPSLPPTPCTGATNIVVGTLQIHNAATFANSSAINLSAFGRLDVNVANQSLAKVSGSGVVAGSFLRYSLAQTTGGTGPGTIFGTVELNNAAVNPNYVLDFGTGSTLTNVISKIAKQLSLYNNTPASWTAANIDVKGAATLALNVDSAGTAGLDSNHLNILLTNISVANSTAEGLQFGASLGIATATGASFTQGNVIANSTGASGGAIGLTKLGAGTLILDHANTYTGRTLISGGSLQLGHAQSLNGGIGSTGGIAGLTFNGGVLGLGAGDFSRPLAAAGTAGAVTFTGAGGWAAYGADRAVNLGGASASITWATASTGLSGQTFILGNATSTHTVDFQNPLVLDAANRTVQVDNGSAAIDGKLSGALSGGGTEPTSCSRPVPALWPSPTATAS